MKIIRRVVELVCNSIVNLVFRVIYVKKYLKLKKNMKPKVLFCVRNRLMYSYVSKVWEAYANKDDYDIHLCYICIAERALFVLYSNLLKLGKREGFPVWPHIVAKNIDWDIIICAAPNDMSNEFRKSIPKVMLPHALCNSKIIEESWYPYIPRFCFAKDNTPVFDVIFEANEFSYERVINEDRRFDGVIELTGGVTADILLKKNIDREKIRNDFGYTNDDYVILIQSTFAASLMEDLGEKLIKTCQSLVDKDSRYKFVISLHPEHWIGDYANKHPWGRRISRYESANIRIRQPEENPDLGMIASDMCFSDHTSLCFNYALLDKPLLFYIPPKASIIWEVFQPLVDICSQFDDVSQFEGVLAKARENYDSYSRKKIMSKYITYQGQANVRATEIFNRLLERE